MLDVKGLTIRKQGLKSAPKIQGLCQNQGYTWISPNNYTDSH